MLLCPWDSPDKNTGEGCHFLLQGILWTQGSNLCLPSLLYWQVGFSTTEPNWKAQDQTLLSISGALPQLLKWPRRYVLCNFTNEGEGEAERLRKYQDHTGKLSFLFFFYNLIYFNWRLITLQYCIGFAIHQHESATVYTCSPSWTSLPPPSPYHPSGSSQCTSPKHPVSCIEPGKAIHFLYHIIHVSVPSRCKFPLDFQPIS